MTSDTAERLREAARLGFAEPTALIEKAADELDTLSRELDLARAQCAVMVELSERVINEGAVFAEDFNKLNALHPRAAALLALKEATKKLMQWDVTGMSPDYVTDRNAVFAALAEAEGKTLAATEANDG